MPECAGHHRQDCASPTLLNSTGSIRQWKALMGGCVASVYSRWRFLPCTEAAEPGLRLPAFTNAVGSSIGVGLASAAELRNTTKTTGIRSLISAPFEATLPSMSGAVRGPPASD